MLKKLVLPIAAVMFLGLPMTAEERVTTPGKDPITMPDGIEPSLYVDSEGNKVYVAIDGTDIYFQGLSTRYPEFTVKGAFNGTIASIPQWQFVERYGDTYDIYTRINLMDYNDYSFYPAPDDYTYNLTVDLSKGTISCPKEDAYVLFGFAIELDGEWQWVDYRQYINLKLYVDYTGIPENPSGLEVEKYDGDDFYSFMFTLPLKTTNGNPMSVYDTYYVIYVNGEEYTFTPDEELGIYPELPYPVTEMPAYFSNNVDIVANGEGHLVGIYLDEIESVSVQTVYRYGQEITKSEIVTWGNAGVESLVDSADVISVEYFDLSGRKVVNPEKGVYIKRQRLSDGSARSVKIAK